MKITKNNHLKKLIALSLVGATITSCNMTDMEDVSNQSSSIYKSTGLSTSPNILYQETFEGSDPLSFTHKQLSESYSFGVATNPAFAGSYSGRFELNDDDDMVSNGTRAEVLFPEQDENERWYAYQLYLPSSDFKIDSNNDIISQWHQGSGSGSPTTTLRIEDDRFFLKSGDTKETRKDYDIAAVKKDAWNEFVFHIIHSSGDDGLVEVWFNGTKVIDLKGGNMDKDFGLPRWKIGIYKDDWNGDETTDSDRRVMFFDNVRMGDENASFEEMSSNADGGASTPETTPEEEVETPSEILPEGEGTIQSLTLINTSTDDPVGGFVSGAQLTAKDHRLSIVPNFISGVNPAEVKFDLSGTDSRSLTDDDAPFSLNGDDGNGNFWYGEGLYPGDYELLITPYFEVNGVLEAGTPELFTFTLTAGDENNIDFQGDSSGEISVDGPVEEPVDETTEQPVGGSISSLTLINTSTDKAIADFNSGDVITAKNHRLSILPNFDGTTPKEVRFELSGEDERSGVDDEYPFALNGDDGAGNFWYGDGLYPGDYQLEITPYYEVNGDLVEGSSELFTFTIVEGNSTYIN